MSPRRLVYLALWGTTGLALLSKIRLLPAVLRFVMYASAMICNSPGVVLLGQGFGYTFTRTVLGHLLAALITSALVEPVLRWIERPLRRRPQDPQAPASVTRRALLLSGGGLALSAGVAGYSYAIERKNFWLRSHQLYLTDLPPALEGLRLVVVADLHCGPVNRPGDLRPAIEMVNRLKPDLILIPGDFVHLSPIYFAEAAELLSLLQPAIPGGVLISWGNHDHWNDVTRARTVLGDFQQLIDRRCVLRPDRSLDDSGSGLWLAGLDDLWEGSPDLNATLRGIPADQPRLVLCHNPDLAEVQHGERVDLMLSGHTHGGQVQLPLLGTPILPSRYGQKYAAGLVHAPHYPVYVTRGLGVGGIPIRLGVPPEVTCFVLHRSRQGFQMISEDYATT